MSPIISNGVFGQHRSMAMIIFFFSNQDYDELITGESND